MPDRLLICTDLDRTLIPNGPAPESPGARERFARLAARPEMAPAYVSGFGYADTVFCGDSGNDIEVLASPVPVALVANSPADVQELARRLAGEAGQSDRLFLVPGDFMEINGNYSAGILEGIAHYHPGTIRWMGFMAEASPA
jgi:hypothetical protein